MTPQEAKDAGHAFFDNRWGLRTLCCTSNPHLWPHTKVYNAEEATCEGCLQMMAERVEVQLDKEWWRR